MLFCHDFGNVVNDAISVQFFEPKMMRFATMIGVGAVQRILTMHSPRYMVLHKWNIYLLIQEFAKNMHTNYDIDVRNIQRIITACSVHQCGEP